MKSEAMPTREARFVVRRGKPWPFIRCKNCEGVRHYEPARNENEWEEIEMDMVKFALSHRQCPWIVVPAKASGAR